MFLWVGTCTDVFLSSRIYPVAELSCSHVTVLTVQPSIFSATGLLRVQLCRVPVWSVRSTSRSKPAVAEKSWSLPGQNWLAQLSPSSLAMNLHLELRQMVEVKHQRIRRGNNSTFTLCDWPHHRVRMTFETEESRSSLEMKLYAMP